MLATVLFLSSSFSPLDFISRHSQPIFEILCTDVEVSVGLSTSPTGTEFPSSHGQGPSPLPIDSALKKETDLRIWDGHRLSCFD
jgi:hypothetical protein